MRNIGIHKRKRKKNSQWYKMIAVPKKDCVKTHIEAYHLKTCFSKIIGLEKHRQNERTGWNTED